MDEIINAVATSTSGVGNVVIHEQNGLYKFTCINFTIYIPKSVINETKAEFSLTGLSATLCNRHVYEQIFVKNICKRRIRAYNYYCFDCDSSIDIVANHGVAINLSNIYFAALSFRDRHKPLTQPISCFCIDLDTYFSYGTCPYLQYSAVFFACMPMRPAYGVKKIFVTQLSYMFEKQMPDALIIYSAEFEYGHQRVHPNKLCYAFEEYIFINMEHEQLNLLNYYLATLNEDIGTPIEHTFAEYPFQCYATKIGYDLICNIDLDDKPLLKNANSFTSAQ
jgi:hypothetical protein